MKSKTDLSRIALYIKLLSFFILLIAVFQGINGTAFGKVFFWTAVCFCVAANLFFWYTAVLMTKECYAFCRDKKIAILRKRMMQAKLGAIPYFILNLLLWLLVAFLLFGASRGLVLFTPIPVIFAIQLVDCFLCMAATSINGMGFVILLHNSHRMNAVKMILYILLLLCFCLDVVAVFMLGFKKKYAIPDEPGDIR